MLRSYADVVLTNKRSFDEKLAEKAKIVKFDQQFISFEIHTLYCYHYISLP